MKAKHVLLVVFSIVLLGLGSWGIRYLMAPIKGKVEAREHIESSDHRLYSYEHFYDMYAQIRSYETALSAQQEALEYAETSAERQRIRANIAGIKAQRRRSIEKYNADAKKVKTRGKFKADDLPYQIEY
jgi:hypothetical protein